MHLDAGIRLANTKQNQRTALPDRVLPGKPRWLPPGGELPAIDTGARAKIQIYATPHWTGTETRFASDRFAATYFRALMVFNAQDAALSWARAVPTEILGGAAAESGFVFCTADGKVLRFGAAGGDAGSVDLGAPLRACVVDADTLVVPAGDPIAPLADQLAQVLAVLDPEMAAAQAFLVTELGRIEDPSVAKTLITLTTSPRIPPDVRTRARNLLAQRRSGAEYMLSALAQQYDFLSGTLPPPVGPLAIALAAMKENRAAPLLARHLNDPSTELSDLEFAAKALAELATPAELPSLKTFFALYRATADEPALVNAVVSVAQALLRVGGPEAKELVERATRDPLTRPDVTRALAALIAAPPSPSANAAR
jgi:outer membrane protein assembly factor BamB